MINMGLNKQKGNIYPWVIHKWNPANGKCLRNSYDNFLKWKCLLFKRGMRAILDIGLKIDELLE